MKYMLNDFTSNTEPVLSFAKAVRIVSRPRLDLDSNAWQEAGTSFSRRGHRNEKV